MAARPRRAILLVWLLSISGCVSRSDGTRLVDPGELEPQTIDAPARAHFGDGSIVVFRRGAIITADSVVAPRGQARRYSVAMTDSADVRAVSRAGLVGLELHEDDVDVWATVLIQLLAWGPLVALVAAIASGAGGPVIP